MQQDNTLNLSLSHLNSSSLSLKVKSELYNRQYTNGVQNIRCPILNMLNSIECKLPNDILDAISSRIGSSEVGRQILTTLRVGRMICTYGEFAQRIEYVLRNVLRQDMFSPEQKLGMARWVLDRCRKLALLCRANDHRYGCHHYDPDNIPVYNEIGLFTNVSYDSWCRNAKEDFRQCIENAYQGELAFSDFTKYDISDLDFIIGDCVSIAKRLMAAEYSSQLDVERNSAIADFQQFCSAVDSGAAMGWRRENVYYFEAMIGHSQVWAKIWDDGKLTSFKKRYLR